MSWNLINNKKELGFYSKDLQDAYIIYSFYLTKDSEFLGKKEYLNELTRKLKGVKLLYIFINLSYRIYMKKA